MKLFRKQHEDNVKQEKKEKTEKQCHGWLTVLPLAATLIFSGCAAKMGDLQLSVPGDVPVKKTECHLEKPRTSDPTLPLLITVCDKGVEHHKGTVYKKISELSGYCSEWNNGEECAAFGKELSGIADPDAIPLLVGLLEEETANGLWSLDESQRESIIRGAIEALVKMKHLEVLDILLKMLESDDGHIQMIAADYLQKMNKPYLTPMVLGKILEKEDLSEKMLKSIDCNDAVILSELKAALSSKDKNVQVNALMILSHSGMLIPALADLLRGDDNEKLSAISIIEAIQSPEKTFPIEGWEWKLRAIIDKMPDKSGVAAALLKPIKDIALFDNSATAVPAAKLLVSVKTTESSDALIAVISKSVSLGAREVAAVELGDRKYQKAEEKLITLAVNSNYYVNSYFFKEDFIKKAEKTDSFETTIYDSGEYEYVLSARKTAIWALGQLESKKAVPTLIDFLPDAQLGWGAMGALENACKNNTCPMEPFLALLDMWSVDKTNIPRILTAIAGLADMGDAQANAKCYKKMLSLLDHPLMFESIMRDGREAGKAVDILIKIDAAAAGPDLLKKLTGKKWKTNWKEWPFSDEESYSDEEVQVAVIDGLANLGYKGAVKPLIGLMNSKSTFYGVRESAVIALGEIGGPTAIAALKKASGKQASLQAKCDKIGALADKKVNEPLNKLYEAGEYDVNSEKVKALFHKMSELEDMYFPLSDELAISEVASQVLEDMGAK